MTTTFTYSGGTTSTTTSTTISSSSYVPSKANVLIGVSFASTVQTITNSAFRNCLSLPSLTIPNTVTSVGTINLFYGCSALTSVTFPSGGAVTTIGDSAFVNCVKLTSVNVPTTVTSIGQSAFDGCSVLPSITIPAVCTSISANAFARCPKLKTIVFSDSAANPTTIDSTAFTSVGTGTPNPLYPTVTFYNATSSASLTPALQSVVWPTNTVLVYNPSCFLETTCILCLTYCEQTGQWID